ncbi:MAG: NUDIX hydrolase [Promethearchaeota archaeon]
MPKLDILWEGKLLLDYIKWNKKLINKFKFSNQYKTEAKKHWNKHTKENPNDYDGTLIFLSNYYLKNNLLLLDIEKMKFSMATYMLTKTITLTEGLGVLGTQYLVFSPNLEHILIGQRALSQSYFPGAINIPGGIVEINDLDRPPQVALTRELFEEVCIPLKPTFFLRAILGGWDNISITFLISATVSESYDFKPDELVSSDKNEWEGHLKWLSISSLEKMPSDNFLDGLVYYQLKLNKDGGFIE